MEVAQVHRSRKKQGLMLGAERAKRNMAMKLDRRDKATYIFQTFLAFFDHAIGTARLTLRLHLSSLIHMHMSARSR